MLRASAYCNIVQGFKANDYITLHESAHGRARKSGYETQQLNTTTVGGSIIHPLSSSPPYRPPGQTNPTLVASSPPPPPPNATPAAAGGVAAGQSRSLCSRGAYGMTRRGGCHRAGTLWVLASSQWTAIHRSRTAAQAPSMAARRRLMVGARLRARSLV